MASQVASMPAHGHVLVMDELQHRHPFLGETTTIGLLVHLQARLLARFLRGELDAYPAFFAR